jgi:hypothetical protein
VIVWKSAAKVQHLFDSAKTHYQNFEIKNQITKV